MWFTPEQRAQIAGIYNDDTIDWHLLIAEERKEFGDPIHQKIPVSDEILLAIILQSWQHTPFEECWSINWKNELVSKTDNQDFLDFLEVDLKPYRVRAGMLLEGTKDFKDRMKQEEESPSHMPIGSEIIAHHQTAYWLIMLGSHEEGE